MAKKSGHQRTDSVPAAPRAATPEPTVSAEPRPRPVWVAAGAWVVDLLTSVKLGVTLLALVLLWVALGTFDPVLQGTDFTMIGWYSWWPFNVVMYLMCANLSVVTFRRIPLNLPNLGVWVIHGSILLIAAGSTWFGLAWVDAVTRIDRGMTQDFAWSHSDADQCLHFWPARTQGRLAPHADDWTGYSPNDRSEQTLFPSGLTNHRFRGGRLLSDASIRSLRDTLPEGVAGKLLKIRGKHFHDAADLKARLGEVLTADEARAHTDAIVAAAEVDEYSVGPFEAHGVKFTVTRSWPTAQSGLEFEDGGPAVDADPAVFTVFPKSPGTRKTLYANDVPARQMDVLHEREDVDRLWELLRPAYDAVKRNDDKAVEALIGPDSALVEQIRALRAGNSLGRRFVWRAQPISQEDYNTARAFYNLPARQRTHADERRLALVPPLPVERLVITDPRFTKPILVYMDEWEQRREISLDSAGLRGEKLVLERLSRDNDGQLNKMIEKGLRKPGERMPVMFLYKLVSGDRTVETRACMVEYRHARVRGEEVLVADTNTFNADPGAGSPASIPPTAPLMVHFVQHRTIAVTGLQVALGERTETVPWVWMLEPGRAPEWVGDPRGIDRKGGAEFSIPFGGFQVEFDVVLWRNRVAVRKPVVAGTDDKSANKFLCVTAEKSYVDAGGVTRNWSRTVWIPKIDIPDNRRVEIPDQAVSRLQVPMDGGRTELLELAWAGKRVPLGPGGNIRAKLEKFTIEYLPGSKQPKEYSSYVTINDVEAAGSEPQTVKICMNEPKKADGWWFSQNDYDKETDAQGRSLFRYTILSVAYKPAWSDPPLIPYAMATLVLGVLWAFLVKPLILAHRRERSRRGGEASSTIPGKSS